MSVSKKLNILVWVGYLLSCTLLTPPAYAAGDPAVVAVLYKMWDWAKDEMMQKMQNFQQGQTNQLKDKAESVFEKKAHWEQWPASLKEMLVERTVTMEVQGKQVSYKNAQNYLKYTQGTASGFNASKYPAQVTHSFNEDYQKVQHMNPTCQLNVPGPTGDTSHQCSPAQQQFTNYLLTGVHPIPDYPEDSIHTSDGEAYVQAKHVNEARTALAQVALDEATNAKTNQFIEYMQKQLQNPTLGQINQESSAAIARDTLILEKARAIIALKQYEATLMNQRLLATLVAQNESGHLRRIRQLAQNLH